MNPKIILSPKNGPHAYYVVDAAGNTVNYSIREALVKLAYEKGDLIEFDTGGELINFMDKFMGCIIII